MMDDEFEQPDRCPRCGMPNPPYYDEDDFDPEPVVPPMGGWHDDRDTDD